MSVIIDCTIQNLKRKVCFRVEQRDEDAEFVINLLSEIKGLEVHAIYFPEVIGWEVTDEWPMERLLNLTPQKV